MRGALAGCVLTAAISAGNAGAREEIKLASLPDTSNRPPSAPGTQPEEPPTLMVAQVELNGRLLADPVFVAMTANDLLVPVNLLSSESFRKAEDIRTIGNREFVSASSLKANRVEFDPELETLLIDCSADCFNRTLVSARPQTSLDLSPVTPGAFFNYDLFAQSGDLEDRAGALVEVGFFTGSGTGVTNAACSGGDIEGECIRLDTTWTVDTPSSALRLNIGDSITRAASWGAPARFGGIRFGTDFSLTPDYITFPTPSLSGDAALPGSVDLIVNDAERFSSEIPAGPFTLTDVPVVTGAGSAQLVVTDVLGRESVVTTDYYVAPQLLRPGLKEWSVEAGFLREDYGLRSNRYDQGFVAGGLAQGITDELTLAARSELTVDQQSAGVSGAFLNPKAGIFQVAAAMSRDSDDMGGLFDLGHEWRSKSFSLGSSLSYTTEHYRQFGRSFEPPRLTARTFASYTDDTLGALSLTWTHRDERIQDDFSTFGLRYTRMFGSVALNLSALQLSGPHETTIASLSLSMPLSGDANSSMGIDYRAGEIGGNLGYRRSAPSTGGLGYYGRASVDGIDRYEAGADIRTRYGDASAAFSEVNDRSATRLNIRGGAAFVDKTLVLAPSITDSIAVINVADEPGVRVYQDRQLIGVTDKRGQVVLTRLRPFERNEISFNPRDVGLNKQFEDTTMTIVPGLRTGHSVHFENSQSCSAMAYVVDRNGAPLNSDGRIANIETGELYPIGQGGRIYLADAQPVTRLKFIRDRVICEAEIRLQTMETNAPYQDVGEVQCLPVAALR